MGNSEISDARQSLENRFTYQRILETASVELGEGQRAWRRIRAKYEVEGDPEAEQEAFDYREIDERLDEDRRDETLSPDSRDTGLYECNETRLTADTLLRIAKSAPSVRERARALAELMRRGNSEVPRLVAEELGRHDLTPTWRNTLIFACEHLSFRASGSRQRLRDQFNELVAALNAEWHPRSKLAQEAALRRYISMIDDNAQLVEIVRFMSTDYPIRVRLIALLGVQNAFAAAPPTESVQSELQLLSEELKSMVDFFFREATLERSEEDFDLGLTALEALIRLGDPFLRDFLVRARQIGRQWVVRQLKRFIAETRTRWSLLDTSTCSEPIAALDEAVCVLQGDG